MGENLWEKIKSENYQNLSPVIFLPTPEDHTIYSIKDGKISPLVRLDVIFPVMHGTYSEDGTLQGLLELADIAYVGAGVLGSSACMDKGLFKAVMVANNIPTLPYRVFTRKELKENPENCLNAAESIADYPLFTKPANLGSSVGISKCGSRSDLV